MSISRARNIINRRKRKKLNVELFLQLTSMMDILIIIVVFMLKSYATNSVAFATLSGIELPQSTSQEVPSDSLNLVVEPTGITFDNEKILEFNKPQNIADMKDMTAENTTYEIPEKFLRDGGRRILPLFDAMVKAREKTEFLMSKAKWVAPKKEDGAGGETVPPKFQGAVVVQADKRVRYELLRKIMYTAGAAQYKVFKFVSLQKEAL